MVHKLSSARISRSVIPVKLEPNHHCESSSELLFGESVLLLEQNPEWCKIRCLRDGYEGFVETVACDLADLIATHWVNTKATLVFDSPDIKAPVIQRLLFGSQLALSDVGNCEKFLELGEGGFVWAAHCADKNTPLKSSMIEIAQKNYLHAPYLWGGRSTDGCDCSGLVQMVAMASGVSIPRDSVDQEAALRSDVEYDSRTAEDLVYWPGHVGLLTAQDTLLHSTAHSMRCCIEPLTDVVERAGFPSSVKRLEKNRK